MVTGFGAAFVITITILCTAAHAETGGSNNPSFLLFAGTDLWRDGAFVNGGGLWSPAGLDRDGFTLKLLLSGGFYVYPSSGLGEDVRGTALSVSALPGWRVVDEGLTLDVFVGPVVQDYRLMPFDPGSSLRGTYAGAQLATDFWYQPNAATMIALDNSIATIGLIGSARAAFGWRSTQPFFIGPETQAIWCSDYQQFRLGAHITGFKANALEWSAAAGWAMESFRRQGPYLRLGVNARY